MAEEDILYNWENFITNVFRWKVSQTSITIDDDTFQETQSPEVITLNDVTMFTTGSYQVPFMRLECKVEIEFEHEPQEGYSKHLWTSSNFSSVTLIQLWFGNILKETTAT